MTTTTTTRRCIGSVRFGIEPHEAPISDFPEQPSRKDGLGLMCAVHWKAYVKGLRLARVKALAEAPTTVQRLAKAAREAGAKVTIGPAKLPSTKRERRRTPMAHVPDPKVVEAEALIAEVDALPADQMVKRVGDDDVQAALGTVNGNGYGHAPDEAVDGGTEAA